ncbi:Putative Type III effector NopL-like fragment [Bradyrhizobium vignae]|uniref:Type III effector NopL-like n=1 Tax=Bradyrhizobium vignae TaxID=1549949 RepID=A0A2U3QAL7_9BRAD|nr:Putative Type III effector NopL-like fragment [Bradyrhizobium vignae]
MHKIPEYSQDLIWQELGAGSSRVEPSLSGGERTNSQQPIAQHRVDASEFGNDLVWQDPGHLNAGPSQADSRARTGCSAGTWRFRHGERPSRQGRVGLHWPNRYACSDRNAKKPQSHTDQGSQTITFTNLGVPVRAEWREEGSIRIKPSLNSALWPVGSSEHSPSG